MSFGRLSHVVFELNRHTGELHRDHMGDAFLGLLEGQCRTSSSIARSASLKTSRDLRRARPGRDPGTVRAREHCGAHARQARRPGGIDGRGRDHARHQQGDAAPVGLPYSVSLVRAALFNAVVSWAPIDLDC